MPASVPPMNCRPLGDSAVLIELGDEPSKILSWTTALQQNRPTWIADVAPSYTIVAVFYDPIRASKIGAGGPYQNVCAWLADFADRLPSRAAVKRSEHSVPVCYGGEHGPDLDEVAQHTGLRRDEVVKLHSGAVYTVRAVGFSPGFPYLAGLPKRLHVPRRATPRPQVLSGSVGIGGSQTGIYSFPTPGGWNLIGRTPWRLFDSGAAEPARFRVGDVIKFVPIAASDFEEPKR